MAESHTLVTITDLFRRIDILSSQDDIFSSGFLTDIRQLRQILSRFRDVLLDPDHVLPNLDEKLSNPLRKVDELFAELEHEAFTRRGSCKRKVCLLIWRVKIKLISHRLAKIPTLNRGVLDVKPPLSEMIPITHSEEFFSALGRGNDKDKIIKILEPNFAEMLSVVPIVGTAGVGKSTLARLVYNDTTIHEYFQLKIWVNVSEDFDIIRLFNDVFTSVIDRMYFDFNENELLDRLQITLQGKKIFLVLDNVRNINHDKWEKVKYVFKGVVAMGSKILVTTRSEIVASITGTLPTYYLQGLSSEHSMSLFLRSAFGDGDERCDNPESNEICGEIVRKSGRIPLVIRSLGTLLHQINRSDGLSFIDKSLNLEGEAYSIKATLKLSYAHLPPDLQTCFAYCAFFPKGYRFNSDYLIQCWMAAGFLTTHNEIEELEDVGLRYCKVLFFRCFFQDVENHGHYFTFKIHDLLHDFIAEEAEGDCSIVDLRHKPKVNENVRHVSFINSYGYYREVPGILKGLRHVETITFPILQRTHVDESFINALLWSGKYLRFLCLNGLQFKKLPPSICELKSLRFLDLSRNRVLEELSLNICELQSLQSLLLLGCSNLRRLEVTADEKNREVSGIADLRSLRYLHLHGCRRLQSLSFRSQSLISLRTLILQDCPSLAALPDITYPQTLEKLVIHNCPLSSVLWPGSTASLQALSYIRIEACRDLTELPAWLPDISSLKTLEIVNCPELSSLPDGMQKLANLTQLKIQNCPILSESCRQWNSLISHVPNIQLDPAIASSSREE